MMKTAAPASANEVSLFMFKDAEVRVVKIDGEPWFVATDVAAALALCLYADGSPNVTAATRGIDKSEKHLLRRTTPHLTLGSVERLFTFRQPSLLLITESALYKMVLRSNKPEAKDFQPLALRTG